MTDIILSVENNEAVVSSRQIAEDFGKRHNDVMEAIRSILATENSVTKFFHESTFEYRGQTFPMYLMNRDGFSLLVMGFTGKSALEWKVKYITHSMRWRSSLPNQSSYPKQKFYLRHF